MACNDRSVEAASMERHNHYYIESSMETDTTAWGGKWTERNMDKTVDYIQRTKYTSVCLHSLSDIYEPQNSKVTKAFRLSHSNKY